MSLSRYIVNVPLELTKKVAQKRIKDINTILKASMMVSIDMPFSRALDVLVEMSNRIIHFDKCIIYFIDEEKDQLTLSYQKGFDKDLPLSFHYGNPLSRLSFEYGQPILIMDLEKEKSIKIMRIEKALSFLSIPIYSNGKVNGTIQFFNNKRNGFSIEDIILVNLLIIQFESMLTRIISRPPLELLAVDTVTDLFKRSFFEKEVTREFERAKRQDSPLSMLKVQLDHFDSFQRDVGQRKSEIALREIADIHRKTGREMDIFSYFGQGIFASLLPGTDIAGALSAGKRIQKAIENHRFIGPDGTRNVEIKVFIGISSFPLEAKNPEDLYQTVDLALYMAKRRPEIRICTSSDVPFMSISSLRGGKEAIDLEKLNRATNSAFNLDRLLNLILQISIESLKARRASLMIRDKVSSDWIIKVIRGFTGQWDTIETLRVKELGEISSLVVKQKRPIVSENIEELRNLRRGNLPHYKGKSFISFPLIDGNEVYGLIHISEKKDGSPFIKKDLKLFTPLAILIDSFLKEGLNFEYIQKDFIKKALILLIEIFECKNPQFLGHSKRVAHISLSIGKEMRLSEEDVECLYFSALCHDIGSIFLSETIWNKPAYLDLTERKILNQHPILGEKILKTIPFLRKAGKVILSHHENFDGTGYPEGRVAEEIPLLSRIISVSESFDAMISNRPYRIAVSREKALEEINSKAGRLFDPIVVSVLKKVVG
jgi:diguanylate cyclase (GGDEF)-like protein